MSARYSEFAHQLNPKPTVASTILSSLPPLNPPTSMDSTSVIGTQDDRFDTTFAADNAEMAQNVDSEFVDRFTNPPKLQRTQSDTTSSNQQLVQLPTTTTTTTTTATTDQQYPSNELKRSLFSSPTSIHASALIDLYDTIPPQLPINPLLANLPHKFGQYTLPPTSQSQKQLSAVSPAHLNSPMVMGSSPLSPTSNNTNNNNQTQPFPLTRPNQLPLSPSNSLALAKPSSATLHPFTAVSPTLNASSSPAAQTQTLLQQQLQHQQNALLQQPFLQSYGMTSSFVGTQNLSMFSPTIHNFTTTQSKQSQFQTSSQHQQLQQLQQQQLQQQQQQQQQQPQQVFFQQSQQQLQHIQPRTLTTTLGASQQNSNFFHHKHPLTNFASPSTNTLFSPQTPNGTGQQQQQQQQQQQPQPTNLPHLTNSATNPQRPLPFLSSFNKPFSALSMPIQISGGLSNNFNQTHSLFSNINHSNPLQFPSSNSTNPFGAKSGGLPPFQPHEPIFTFPQNLNQPFSVPNFALHAKPHTTLNISPHHHHHHHHQQQQQFALMQQIGKNFPLNSNSNSNSQMESKPGSQTTPLEMSADDEDHNNNHTSSSYETTPRNEGQGPSSTTSNGTNSPPSPSSTAAPASRSTRSAQRRTFSQFTDAPHSNSPHSSSNHIHSPTSTPTSTTTPGSPTLSTTPTNINPTGTHSRVHAASSDPFRHYIPDPVKPKYVNCTLCGYTSIPHTLPSITRHNELHDYYYDPTCTLKCDLCQIGLDNKKGFNTHMKTYPRHKGQQDLDTANGIGQTLLGHPSGLMQMTTAQPVTVNSIGCSNGVHSAACGHGASCLDQNHNLHHILASGATAKTIDGVLCIVDTQGNVLPSDDPVVAAALDNLANGNTSAVGIHDRRWCKRCKKSVGTSDVALHHKFHNQYDDPMIYYKCTKCKFGYTKEFALLKHLRTNVAHQGETQEQMEAHAIGLAGSAGHANFPGVPPQQSSTVKHCTRCDKFITTNAMAKHQSQHDLFDDHNAAATPWKCYLCLTGYSNQRSLTRHNRISHPDTHDRTADEKITCQRCSQQVLITTFERHQILHLLYDDQSIPKTQKCHLCELGFEVVIAFEGHLQRHEKGAQKKSNDKTKAERSEYASHIQASVPQAEKTAFHNHSHVDAHILPHHHTSYLSSLISMNPSSTLFPLTTTIPFKTFTESFPAQSYQSLPSIDSLPISINHLLSPLHSDNFQYVPSPAGFASIIGEESTPPPPPQLPIPFPSMPTTTHTNMFVRQDQQTQIDDGQQSDTSNDPCDMFPISLPPPSSSPQPTDLDAFESSQEESEAQQESEQQQY